MFCGTSFETRPKPRDANPLAILQCRLITTAVADARGAQDPRAMPFDRGKRQRMRVCDRWRSFANFYLDVGRRPSWRHLLIRDDATGEFGPGNARWQIAARYRWARPTTRSGCGTA